MKRIVKVIALCMALFVGGAFVLPAQMGTLDSHAAAKVKISKTKATVIKGKTMQLKMKGTRKKTKWTSSKKSVATVSTKGKVTAKKAGTATITAKLGKKKYKCKVTVKNPTTKLNKTSLTLKPGGKYTLKASSNGASKKVSWKSSNSSVATVTTKGVITAKKAGTARITAKMNGISKSCTVKVYNPVGSRSNPANLRNGATIVMPGGTAYVKLDRTLKGTDAIAQLNNMGEWDSYSQEDYADHPNTQLVYFEYTVKTSKGFFSSPFEGLDIINEFGLYNSTCTANISYMDALYLHNRYESQDKSALTLYGGSSSKMYMVLYVPYGVSSFSYPIWKSDYTYFWTKYTF